jgi:hypothetical protein
MGRPVCFSGEQILVVGDATAVAEELVFNAYKMSAGEWLKNRYDVATLESLADGEIAEGPLAQIIRYQGRRPGTSLGSSSYDFYKICLQDHNILAAPGEDPRFRLFPFALYIMCHELIHIVRFAKFLQSFDAACAERLAEEGRVHGLTRDILKGVRVPGLDVVLARYKDAPEMLDTRSVAEEGGQAA